MTALIHFVGGGDKPTTVRLDMDVDDVGLRLSRTGGFQQFERNGRTVWVNADNVLYVEEIGKPAVTELSAV